MSEKKNAIQIFIDPIVDQVIELLRVEFSSKLEDYVEWQLNENGISLDKTQLTKIIIDSTFEKVKSDAKLNSEINETYLLALHIAKNKIKSLKQSTNY